MFNVSEQALAVVRQVTAHPVLGRQSGLLIELQPAPGAPMHVGAVREPDPEVEVIDIEGGRIYLGPGVRDRIDGHEVDVTIDDRGRMQFVLRTAS